MKETDTKVVPYDSVERQYPDEWVLVEILKWHSDYRKNRVRLIDHSPNRDELEGPYRRARAEAPNALLGEFYTGKVEIPEGMVAVL